MTTLQTASNAQRQLKRIEDSVFLKYEGSAFCRYSNDSAKQILYCVYMT